MAKLARRVRTQVQAEMLRGRDRCESRHPIWGGVRCERMDSEHYAHHADGRTFEWVQFPAFVRDPEQHRGA